MQKNKINFILALHNHQPEGNFPYVFEQNFQTAYQPFIELLAQFPDIKVVQHYSGILWRWLREHQPNFMLQLRRLAAKGQLELMGGAFYEPILVMIPDEDKVGQIKKMSSFLREHFQVNVNGAWLPERVWEPHLVRPLAEAGIRYTVLDDILFMAAGLTEAELLRPYLTEEAGRRLAVFPINEKLRYLIPFAEPEETIAYLAELAAPGGERLVVLADDGEKFGSWPGTYKRVYKQKWLQRFFQLLQENSEWLQVTTFSAYLQQYEAADLVYLPAGSYREMMEWSGGLWRNFLVRYPESNHLHKKMLHVREKLRRLPDSPQKREAQEYLWAGQCNCAYWHGVFGGLYLNFLRSALYDRLLAAEDIADRALHESNSWVEVERKDFNCDGAEEVVVTGPDLAFIAAPAQGGCLLELDFKPKRFNLFDVLTRRKEAYHCNLYEQAQGVCDSEEVKTIHHISRVKEAGLEQLLIYDPYRRASWRDHFFPQQSDLLQPLAEVEVGDFANGRYDLLAAVVEGEVAQLELLRRGTVQMAGETWPILVHKAISYQPRQGELLYSYRLQNLGAQELALTFAVEFNINFLAGQASDRYYLVPGRTLQNRQLNSHGRTANVDSFGLVDEWLGISTIFYFERPAVVWRMPIETVSQSEDGMERVYQGSMILPSWQIKLLPHTPWLLTFTQTVSEAVREVPS
jgi:hypothetical protein